MQKVVDGRRTRFHIRKVTVVADRGMMSRETIKLLSGHDQAPFDYVPGCRRRRQKEVNEEVLAGAGRRQMVAANLEVKEVRVGERRYVVCRNPLEARKDAAGREAILEKLRQKLEKQGLKTLVGHRGYARFLKVARGSVSINEEAVKRDARLDGKFVLTTNTDLPAAQVALTYKSLWRVERTCREQKSTLEVRPIYHRTEDNTIFRFTCNKRLCKGGSRTAPTLFSDYEVCCRSM
ncbi:MAG: transposase [Deltaproteobacteria bacterium]|nr:transposase [Deltaproteobacteria bacterium]